MYRSCLFTPANRPERFAKACATDADLVILDLEDAVSPETKGTARENIRAFLQQGGAAAVRINGVGTQWHQDDVALLDEPGLQAVMLPKAEDPGDLKRLSRAVSAGCRVIALIESALGVWNARELASVPGVDRLAFGSVDFQLDVGLPDCEDEFEQMLFARSRLVLASAVAGISAPLDSVTIALDDPDNLIRDVARAKCLGFSGKLCIHPSQIAAINLGFSPNPQELAQARAIVTAAQGNEMQGAILLNGKLIDRPVIERARRMLEQERRAANQPH